MPTQNVSNNLFFAARALLDEIDSWGIPQTDLKGEFGPETDLYQLQQAVSLYAEQMANNNPVKVGE